MKKIRDEFNKNGYVIVKFFSSKECKKFLKTIRRYANKEFAPIMNPDRLDFLIPQCLDIFKEKKYLGDKANLFKQMKKDTKYLRSIMVNKRIMKYLESIKKKKLNALMSQMIFKEKKTKYSLQSWMPHQDNSYPKNKNGEYITINIFMENSDMTNGTLYIYEKSHKNGIYDYDRRISYREKDSKPGNTVKMLNFKKKNLIFKKGDLLILHGNLVHGSHPNKSKTRSRPLYSVSYMPKGERFIPGLNAQRKIVN